MLVLLSPRSSKDAFVLLLLPSRHRLFGKELSPDFSAPHLSDLCSLCLPGAGGSSQKPFFPSECLSLEERNRPVWLGRGCGGGPPLLFEVFHHPDTILYFFLIWAAFDKLSHSPRLSASLMYDLLQSCREG